MMCNELHKCMHHARNLPIEASKSVELCFANIYVVWECGGGIILPKNCAKNDQYKPIYR
ncbi:hypothetical protein RCIP0004_00052 [Klebsiella phage RCIP0004]